MPLSWLYGKIADFRNAFYEWEVFKSYSLGAPTISVGNLTVGGTGKTPLVAHVAEILAERGEKVCILTRGYGRANPRRRVLVSDAEKILSNPAQSGDEPFELARKLLGKALVVADADRIAAAQWARESFGVSVFVLDDAFQHRQAARDLDIVLLDATNPFGNGKTLPFGILREPLENLARADLVVISRANLVSRERISDLKNQISRINAAGRIFTAGNKVSNLIELKDFNENRLEAIRRARGFDRAHNRELENQKALAFCALGNPENFFEQLRRENFNLAARRKFPDHHRYTPKDIEKLGQQAERTGSRILLTTVKDAVKLARFDFEMPCLVVENALILDDEKAFRRIIGAVSGPKSES